MTQIKGFIQPTRRPGVLGVHSLDHFAISVPDLADAKRFYGNFGLDVREDGRALYLQTDLVPHRWGRLSEGPRKQLQYLSFGAYAEDMGRFREHLERQGVEMIDPPAGIDSNGVWFRDCDGTPVEIKAAEKSSPSAKSVFGDISCGPNLRGASVREAAGRVRPRRMAHVLIFVRDLERSIRFYIDTVGMRLSDRTNFVAFLHGVHGSDHHMLAFAQSDGPGFHHVSWDVGAVHDVGLGAATMADSGFAAGWGLGRHVLGSNFFHYVRDPWGSFSEYSADIDFIPADADWDAQTHKPENSLYLWGPAPPADFITNHESKAANG
jgi:catechol 2,3-dioxygenase-like lactoylglutathione lyase family enzyme